MSSRLFTEVREKRGLGYYVRSSPGNYQDTGSFTVSAGVQVDKIQEAISVIIGELKKIKDVPAGEKEIQKAKEYIKGKTVLALEDNQVRLDWFMEAAAFKPKIETPEEAFKRIDAITSSAIQKAARDLIEKALEETSGNITRAAEKLGLSRKGLQLKIKELGVRIGTR